MIVDQIITEICERLGLTSDEAKSRVFRELNSRYRRLTSSIGLEPTRRQQITGTLEAESNLLTASIAVEKILAVIDKDSGIAVTLPQVTPDEINSLTVLTDRPKHWAVGPYSTGIATALTDCVRLAGDITLYMDVITTLNTSDNTSEPNFPASFHDILIYGVMADEYRRMEKVQLAHDCEIDYERRLSDLRMFIAKSAYLDIMQGKYETDPFVQSSRWSF